MGEISDTNAASAGDASNQKGTPPTPVPVDEPRIIEEHIVKPPPANASSSPSPITAPSTPTPTPPIPVPTTPKPPPAPFTQPILEVKNEVADLTRPPGQPASTAHTPTTPLSVKSMQETDASVNADITHILEGLKIPERETTVPKAPQHTYDTSLTGSAPSTEEKAAREAKVREAARAVNESLPTTAQKGDDIRPVHTLKEDLQDVVRTKKISMVRAVALEEEKRHRPNVALEETAGEARRKNPSLVVVVTISLFLIGVGALGGTYFILQGRTAPVTTQTQVLFAEQTVPFVISNLAPADIKREIGNARYTGGLTLGSILQIIPVMEVPETGQQAPATFGQFLSAIGANQPEELSRSLGDEFFFGFHAVDENAPVIVTTVTSYERAFAAMLEWERTMNGALAPMFTPVSPQMVGTDGGLVERKFEDSVIRNYDVRALHDDGRQIQLYYSFPTRNILIIAESPYSFAELLSRLRADRRL